MNAKIKDLESINKAKKLCAIFVRDIERSSFFLFLLLEMKQDYAML
jgi:hypothetical protein